MKSSKSNWVTLLILFAVVVFIFIKEDSFSKEENYISHLQIYGSEVPLEKSKREYNLTVNEINIRKIGIEKDFPICTCDVTKVEFEKDKYELNTNTIFDYENKKAMITISVTEIDKTNILDTYTIQVTYEDVVNIDEECQKEYVCPSF